MKKRKIVVVGSCNTDLVIKVDHLPLPGETIIGRDFMTNQGGKGANQVVAARRMGDEVVFVARVGNDGFGQQSLHLLEQEGLDPQYVHQTEGVPTGIAMIAVDEKGENSIIVASGANASLSRQDMDAVKEMIEQETAVLLMQLESPLDTLMYVAEMAHKAGVQVVLNPAPFPKEPLPASFLQNIDIIIPNETEAARMVGFDVVTEDDMLRAMQVIQQRGVEQVIITAGKAGSYTQLSGKLYNQPAFPVKPVDTTAAGDTYCGVLCVGLRDGLSLKDAMKQASTAASLSTTRLGAWPSIPQREEILGAMKKW